MEYTSINKDNLSAFVGEFEGKETAAAQINFSDGSNVVISDPALVNKIRQVIYYFSEQKFREYASPAIQGTNTGFDPAMP
jgi:hypothetical protein